MEVGSVEAGTVHASDDDRDLYLIALGDNLHCEAGHLRQGWAHDDEREPRRRHNREETSSRRFLPPQGRVPPQAGREERHRSEYTGSEI